MNVYAMQGQSAGTGIQKRSRECYDGEREGINAGLSSEYDPFVDYTVRPCHHPLQSPVKYPTHIIHRRQISQEWAKIRKFRIVRVIEPGRDGNSVVWVEDV